MADVTKTRAQLIQQALDYMGVLAPGQTASAEDVAKVDNILDAVVDELNGREIVYIDDAGDEGPTGGAIAAAAFLSLADVIAYAAAPSFNLGGDPMLAARAAAAERKLFDISRPASTRRTLRLDRATLTTRWPGRLNFTTGR